MYGRTKLHSAKGFTLIETMIAIVVLAVGVLGLAAMFADSLAYMQGSSDDFIAQQKAQEAAEAIFTAKYTNGVTWAQLQNANVTGGLFLVGPQPVLQPGANDGLVGTFADVGSPPEFILQPGPDGKLGTADDIKVELSKFTRTITIANVATNPNLRTIAIRIDYTSGRFTRSYTMNTYISAFN